MLEERCPLVLAIVTRTLKSFNDYKHQTSEVLAPVSAIISDLRSSFVPELHNFVGSFLPTTQDELISSPLVEWIDTLKDFVVPVYSTLSLADNRQVLNHHRNSKSLEVLWKEAIAHGLRARRTVEALIELSFSLIDGFHNIDLVHPSWRKCFSNLQEKYTYLWFVGWATPFMKHATASFFNRMMLQSETIDKPKFCLEYFKHSGVFLTGIGYQWQCFLLKQERTPGFLKLASSILHYKRGAPCVHPSELLNSTKDWYKQLSRPNPNKHVITSDSLSFQDLERNVITDLARWQELSVSQKRLQLQMQVIRTTREIFQGKRFQEQFPRIPSQKSHFGSSRKDGGAFTTLNPVLSGVYSENRIDVNTTKVDGKVMKTVNLAYVGTKVFPGSSIFIPQCHSHCPKVRREVTAIVMNNYADQSSFEMIEEYTEDNLTFGYRKLKSDYIKHLLGEELTDFTVNCGTFNYSKIFRNEITPVALSEPLKVRLISRGPVGLYYLGSQVQKFMHSILRNHFTFRAIGRPLFPEDIDQLGLCDESQIYLSGDYKAATDLISSTLSLCACEEIIRCSALPDVYSEVLKRGLCGATMKFNDKSLEGFILQERLSDLGSECRDSKGNFIQQSGQLMGSPLSFPILCLINAAMNRYYYELVENFSRTNKGLGGLLTYRLEDVPMMINGDDVLLKCRKGYYNTWKDLVKTGGLVPSIGKNYQSNAFVIINSTLYDQVGPNCLGESNFQQRDYINLGLLFPNRDGFTKLNPDEGWSLDPGVTDLGSISKDLCKGHREIQDRLMSFYIGSPYVRSLLSTVPASVSYYVSKSLGGLGLKNTRCGLLSDQQLKFYSYVADKDNYLAPCVPEVLISNDVPETIWKQVRGEVIGEEWRLSNDEKFSSPPARLIWEAYQSSDTERITRKNQIKGSNEEDSLQFIDGQSIKKGYAAHLVAPSSLEIWGSPCRAWPEHNLSDFPWSKESLTIYDPVDSWTPCGYELDYQQPLTDTVSVHKGDITNQVEALRALSASAELD